MRYQIRMCDLDTSDWDVVLDTDDAVEAVFGVHDGRLYPWPCRVYEDGQLVVECV